MIQQYNNCSSIQPVALIITCTCIFCTGTHESSRVANLNQTLMKSKQTCTQLSEENDHLKLRERELIQKLGEIEKELTEKSKELAAVPSLSRTYPATPLRRGSHPTPSTPAGPLPGGTLVDSLQADNAKLKRDLECIHTNFQLTSQKSQQLKKEKSEMEQSMQELQTLFDKVAGEKDDFQLKFEKAKIAMVNKCGTQSEDREKIQTMSNTIAVLEEDLDKFQKQSIELQEKLQHELSRSLEFQDVIEKLDKQTEALKVDKSSLQLKLDDTLATLERIENDYTSLHSSTQSTSDARTRMGELKKMYTGQLDVLKREKNEIEQKLEAAAKCVDEAQDQISSLTKGKEPLEIKVSALEARNIALMRENKTLTRSSTSEASGLSLKYVELSEQSEDKESRIQELEADVLKLKAQIHDLEKTKSKLSREASRNWDLANKLQKALEMQETSNFELDEVRKQKAHQCTVLEGELDKMKIELTTVQSQKTALVDERTKVLNKMEELEQSNFELTTKLDGIEFDTESAKMSSSEAQEKISDLEDTLRSMKGMLLEKEAQLTSLKFTNEILEGENSTLLSQVTSLSEMVSSRNEKIESLQTQLSKYDLEMGEIAETIAELETVHGSCAQTKQMLDDKIDSLKDRLQEALDFNKEAEMKILSLKLDMKQIQECNNGLEVINTELQDKVQSQYTKIDDLNDLQEDSEKRIKKLELDVEMKSDSLRELLDRPVAQGLENVTFTKSKVKGILKSSSSALRPLQNLVD